MTITQAIDGLSAVAAQFDAFLVDQYGVMHNGSTAYPGAVEAMTRLVALGKAVIVLTNSGKRSGPNIARIERLGFPRASFSTLTSSGEVTWQGLRSNAFGPPFEAGGRCFVVGKAGEDYGLDDLGLIFADEAGLADFLVIAGSDCPATSLDDYRRLLAPAAQRHIPALCANPDHHMISAGALQPAPGAIAAVYESLGGRVLFVGKPYPAIYEQARKAAGSWVRKLLCIGDSLDHDILGGANAGFSTLLVRTGVLAAKTDAEIEHAIQAASRKPDFVMPDLRW